MTNNAEARAREVAIKLIRGESVGAGDGDTFIPRPVSIDQMTAALMLIGNERAAQEREANAAICDQRAAMAPIVSCEAARALLIALPDAIRARRQP